MTLALALNKISPEPQATKECPDQIKTTKVRELMTRKGVHRPKVVTFRPNRKALFMHDIAALFTLLCFNVRLCFDKHTLCHTVHGISLNWSPLRVIALCLPNYLVYEQYPWQMGQGATGQPFKFPE